MNPFLEQEDVWQDFHDSYIPALRDALSPQVSPNFIVKIEEHVYIHEPPAQERFRVGNADVGIMRPRNVGAATAVATATLPAPARIVLPTVDFEKQTFLEIRDRRQRELVTVIELLSPTNKKPGPDREQYLAKRASLLRSPAHFVEIDLLRGWPRMPMEQASPCDYCIMVSQVEERPGAGFWPISLPDRLPVIRIPLRQPLSDASLDLQALLHGVYDRAYYRDYIYEGTPSPPMSPEDAAWASTILGE